MRRTNRLRKKSNSIDSGTGTPACADFVGLARGAQPGVAVPPDFFRSLLRSGLSVRRSLLSRLDLGKQQFLMDGVKDQFQAVGNPHFIVN